MAAAVSTAAVPPASVPAAAKRMATAAGRSMKEAFLMTAEVVMFFPGVMVGKVRRIAAASVSVRRVPIRGIVGIAIAAPTAAAVKASAESAET
jgi:hypothetical protein